MLNLKLPSANVIISGYVYFFSEYPEKFAFNREGNPPHSSSSITLVEAFDVYRTPTNEKKYQIRHFYYNNAGKWTDDTVWFTFDEIRKNGLQHLLTFWTVF